MPPALPCSIAFPGYPISRTPRSPLTFGTSRTYLFYRSSSHLLHHLVSVLCVVANLPCAPIQWHQLPRLLTKIASVDGPKPSLFFHSLIERFSTLAPHLPLRNRSPKAFNLVSSCLPCRCMIAAVKPPLYVPCTAPFNSLPSPQFVAFIFAQLHLKSPASFYSALHHPVYCSITPIKAFQNQHLSHLSLV